MGVEEGQLRTRRSDGGVRGCSAVPVEVVVIGDRAVGPTQGDVVVGDGGQDGGVVVVVRDGSRRVGALVRGGDGFLRRRRRYAAVEYAAVAAAVTSRRNVDVGE